MNFFKKLFSSGPADEEFGTELFKALYVADQQKVVDLFAARKIDINHYSNGGDSILISAVNCASDFKGSDQQIAIINYLLDRGADVNQKNKNGYNALHLALEYHDLSKISLLFITKGNADVHLVEDRHGNSPLFTAIREYGLTWREDQKEINQLRFQIIKELLNRGADPDQKNRHGVSGRQWLDRIPETDKLHLLFGNPDQK